MKLPDLPQAPENVSVLEAVSIIAKEYGEDSYRIRVLRKELAEMENRPVLDRFREKYGNGWWGYGDDVKLRMSRSFEDRTDAMKWLNEQGFEEPTFAKTSFCKDDGTPLTECTLTVQGEFEDIPFTIEASYTRQGIATKHCKVVCKPSYSVVCEIPE